MLLLPSLSCDKRRGEISLIIRLNKEFKRLSKILLSFIYFEMYVKTSKNKGKFELGINLINKIEYFEEIEYKILLLLLFMFLFINIF